MHPLQVYMDRHGLTHRELAVLLTARGCPTLTSAIDQYCIGYRRPRRNKAKAICVALKGEVSVDSLLDFQVSHLGHVA